MGDSSGSTSYAQEVEFDDSATLYNLKSKKVWQTSSKSNNYIARLSYAHSDDEELNSKGVLRLFEWSESNSLFKKNFNIEWNQSRPYEVFVLNSGLVVIAYGDEFEDMIALVGCDGRKFEDISLAEITNLKELKSLSKNAFMYVRDGHLVYSNGEIDNWTYVLPDDIGICNTF